MAPEESNAPERDAKPTGLAAMAEMLRHDVVSMFSNCFYYVSMCFYVFLSYITIVDRPGPPRVDYITIFDRPGPSRVDYITIVDRPGPPE